MARAGITPVVAVALLLGMSVAASGGAYTWVSQVQDQAQEDVSEELATSLEIRDVQCTGNTVELTVRNTGDRDVQAGSAALRVFSDGELQHSADVLGGTDVLGAGTLHETSTDLDGVLTLRRRYRIEVEVDETTATASCEPTVPVHGSAPDCGTHEYLGAGTGSDPFLVYDDHSLQCMESDLDAHYELRQDIDLSGTEDWNGGAGFDPVGDAANFTGTFDGRNHTLVNLHIDRPGETGVGVFHAADTATIRDIGMSSASVTGNRSVGGLAAFNNGTITNAYVTGSVTAMDDEVGGLVGRNHYEGVIRDSYTGATVTGENEVGGLVGDQYDDDNTVRINSSYATGAVSGTSQVGGLVGRNYPRATIAESYATGDVQGVSNVGGLVGFSYIWTGRITGSYATGDVNGSSEVGGLVGDNRDNLVIGSYATGTVTGDSNVGGLTGNNRGSGTIVGSFATGDATGSGDRVGGLSGRSNYHTEINTSYALGDATGDGYVGGLVGYVIQNTDINMSYAAGNVTGNSDVGGLIGYNSATVERSYWDVPASGQGSSAAGTGLGQVSDDPPASEMTGSAAETNMADLDFTDMWSTVSGEYPVLQDIAEDAQRGTRD